MPRQDPNRTYDQTYLRANRDGTYVHRDYAAHYFRWGWAVGRNSDVGIAQKTVLDIGCGPDMQLLTLASHSSMLPKFYVGVDLNPLRKFAQSEAKRAVVYEKTDFTDPATWQLLLDNHGQFDRIVAFECIEHMPVERGWNLLWGARQLLAPGGSFLLSTPVFDGHKARNHVHEYTIPELQRYVEAAGFTVAERFGTFANVATCKPAIDKWAYERCLGSEFSDGFALLWEELKRFHSPDVLANFVAPVIPDESRNNAWRLELKS